MKKPPYLKKNDTVAIIAPARKISLNEIEQGIEILKSWGLNVITGPNTFNENHQFSGTDLQRTEDFQLMLDDPEVKAIFCARGGYGSVRIIDRLDFRKFVENPKWIVGYSDVTVFHSHINRHYQIETLHAEMPFKYRLTSKNSIALKSLYNALFGGTISYSLSAYEFNREGKCRGILTGGNLSMLYSLLGSASDIDTKGKILFIEDIDEYLYHIDRMMMNLKRNDKLDYLSGMIVGGMTGMNDNKVAFGENACEIISRIVLNYNFPVFFGFPAGHIDNNMVLIMGREYEMEIEKRSAIIKPVYTD